MRNFILLLSIMVISTRAFCGGCPEGTKTINFITPGSISLTACTDQDKFMGNQGVRWGIKNNTGDKIEVKFDKVYGLSCGKQETTKADITLNPNESIGGGYFSGHIDLGDPIFPAEKCGKGASLSTVAVTNLYIINLSAKEREERARREQEERRQREKQLEEQQREAQRREQERLEREQERAREAERQAELERKRAVRQNLDYIDNLVGQQKAQSDASYNSYSQRSSQEISELQNKQYELDREIRDLQADRERQEQRMNYEIERKQRDLESSKRNADEAKAELNSSINSYLNSFK